jgi:hypothetical protein
MAAPTALAHESGAEHFEDDYVVHAPGEERELGRASRKATRDDARAAAADAVGPADEVGRWGDLMEWPLVGIHVALMPSGEVVAYDSVGDQRTESYPVHTTTRALTWDPQAPVDASLRAFTATTGVNLFCSGLAHLVDGTLFLAGGNKNAELDGSAYTAVFDGAGFRRTEDMEYERWYPSVTPLANGEMLITEGVAKQSDLFSIPPEIRAIDGEIRTLDQARYPWQIGLYPWMDVGPDGRVFYTGPDPTLRSFDATGEGQWRDLGLRDEVYREYGSHAMYDIGKVLVSGGGGSHPPDALTPPERSAYTVDLATAYPTPVRTGDMTEPRRQHNLTVLADGSVLATGGLSTGYDHVDIANGVYTAELWDPDTGNWTELAAEDRTRQYHSTALLLPDGRVLSSGGGICGACEDNPDPDDLVEDPDPGPEAYLEKNAQVFSPPYLFADDGSPAPRPQITAAPEAVGFDESFAIGTPNGGSIGEVALVRLGAVTHSVNMEQRWVPLDFAASAGALTATSPPNANIAPPGFYMLFLIDDEGVPSVARMIRIELPPPGRVPEESEPDLVAPATNLDRAPTGKTRKRRVTFRFSSDDPGAAFECSLDRKPFRPCRSPLRKRLGKGRHTFAVRAVDPAGNTDASSAKTRFRIMAKGRSRR